MKPKNNLIKPNFFIIGAPKCGTTSLSSYLSEHPNVFFSKIKEPEYFASDFKGRILATEKDYLRLFKEADSIQHKVIGEGSTLYMFSEVAVPNLIEFQPKAKCIVMLRNPTDMVISLHAQHLKSGMEYITSFREAWDAEKDRRLGNRIPLGLNDSKVLYYSEQGKLGSQLKKVMEIVPPEQLKVIIFDDFIHNTRASYLEVLKFLDIPDDGRIDFPVENERRIPRNIIVQNVIRFIFSILLPIKTKFFAGSLGTMKFLNKFISVLPLKENVQDATRNMLTNYYHDEVLLLEELLDLKLSGWR